MKNNLKLNSWHYLILVGCFSILKKLNIRNRSIAYQAMLALFKSTFKILYTGGQIMLSRNDYKELNGIFFSKKDMNRVLSAKELIVVSTVCPDYPHNKKRHTFRGKLGAGISLTSQQHIKYVPGMINAMPTGATANWLILVADLPELVDSQKEFYERVAGSKENYLAKCEQSSVAIQEQVGNSADVKTFSTFYGKQEIDYLRIQEETAEVILEKVKLDRNFASRFNSFLIERIALSEKFRGRRLSEQENLVAAAHAMSLYVTHGTLLRSVFVNKNLVVVNHATANLKHFFMVELVKKYEYLINSPKFPIGIIDENLY